MRFASLLILGHFRTRQTTVPVAAALAAVLVFAPVALAQGERLADLLRQGQAALQAEEFNRAARVFEQAQQISPNRKDVNRGLLLSYLQLGRLADAEAIGTAAVTRWPNDPELLHWLGLAYFKEHKNDLAIPQLQHAADCRRR